MKTRRWLIAGIAAAGILAGTTAAAAATSAPASGNPASAEPPIFAGSEGAEVSGYNVAIDVKGQVATPGVTVIGYRFHQNDPGARFLWIPPGPGSYPAPPFGGTYKIAAYAPNGFPTNLVLTSFGSKVVLEPYTGAPDQVWAPRQYPNDLGRAGWVSDAGTGMMIREQGSGKPLQLISAQHWLQTMLTWHPIGS